MKRTLVLATLILLAAAPLTAEGKAKADRFWSRARISLTLVHAGAATYDLHTTRRGLALGFRERNPLMRPFVTRGGWGQAGAVGFSLGLDLGVSYLTHRLTKRGSPWRILKWQMPITMSISHTIAGVHNHHLIHRHLRRVGHH